MKGFVRQNQFGLLLRRSFGPLWLTHTAADFCDQLVRGALAGALAGLLFLPVFFEKAGASTGLWFVLPGLLLAAYSGQLADFRDPRTLIIGTRAIALAAAGAVAVAIYWEQPAGLFLAAMLAGAQESLFVPARGRLMREVLTDQELAGGNGLILAGWQLGALLGLAAFATGLADRPGRTCRSGGHQKFFQISVSDCYFGLVVPYPR